MSLGLSVGLQFYPVIDIIGRSNLERRIVYANQD